MSQDLKAGSRWVSAVDDTEVIVVKAAGSSGLTLECGGHPMLPAGAAKPAEVSLDSSFAGGTAIGKRFEHDSGLEVLATKAGVGSLCVDGVPLALKDAKPLPASD
jgi:hypothetical protein